MPARGPRAALLLAAIALLIRVAGAMPRRAVPTPSARTRTRAQLAAAAASGRTAASSLTLLEQLAVRPSTETFYRLLLQAFVNYCSEHRRDWSSMVQLDLILADYFTYRYLAGAAANIGSQTVAALAHFTPGLPRQVTSQLPRASRAMQAWRRRTPALTRLPIPKAVMFALAGVLIAWQQAPMAVWLAVAFSAYLRPAEVQRLTTDSIVQPSALAGPAYQFWGLLLHPADLGHAGKTGSFDESILFDFDQYLIPALMALQMRGAAGTPLWSFTLSCLNKMFGLAAATLGISKLRPHLYGLRHGGVSDDLLSQRRTQEQVFRRGRWAVPSSMRRYAKETALLRELEGVHPDVYALGHLVAHNFCLLLENGFIGANLQHLVPARLAAALLAASPTGHTAMRRPASRR